MENIKQGFSAALTTALLFVVSGIVASTTFASPGKATEAVKAYSPPANATHATNVYWGDSHLHTGLSLDAGLFGNTLGPDDAYRLARGEQITASSGLDNSEVERMVNEGESHASEDKAARDAADSRNRADQMVYQVEKTLSENADKFSDEDKKPIEEAIAEVKSALEKDDIEAVKAAGDRLEKASHKLAEIMYKTGAPPEGADPAAGGPEGPAGGAEEDVIDAEVVDEAKTN